MSTNAVILLLLGLFLSNMVWAQPKNHHSQEQLEAQIQALTTNLSCPEKSAQRKNIVTQFRDWLYLQKNDIEGAAIQSNKNFFEQAAASQGKLIPQKVVQDFTHFYGLYTDYNYLGRLLSAPLQSDSVTDCQGAKEDVLDSSFESNMESRYYGRNMVQKCQFFEGLSKDKKAENPKLRIECDARVIRCLAQVKCSQ